MNDEIHTRKAEESDIPEMFRIDVEGWYQSFPDPERGVTIEVLKNRYGKDIENSKSFEEFKKTTLSNSQYGLVAEAYGQVVGWVNLENLDNPNISWLNIYIDRNWQSRGVGRLLMESIIQRFGREVEIHIATPEVAGLVPFYEKFGFVEYPVEGRVEGPGNLFMLQMKRMPEA